MFMIDRKIFKVKTNLVFSTTRKMKTCLRSLESIFDSNLKSQVVYEKKKVDVSTSYHTDNRAQNRYASWTT